MKRFEVGPEGMSRVGEPSGCECVRSQEIAELIRNPRFRHSDPGQHDGPQGKCGCDTNETSKRASTGDPPEPLISTPDRSPDACDYCGCQLIMSDRKHSQST